MGSWNNKSGVPCDDLCASFECGCLGDPTWKERHAKGVPARHKLISNAPEKWILSETESDEFGPILIASLVNFRYKPEWLEKKGGANV